MANHHRFRDFGRNSGRRVSFAEIFPKRRGVQVFQGVPAVFLDTVYNPVDIHAG